MRFDCSRFWRISLASARLLDYKKGSLGLNVQILVHFPGCHWVRFDCSRFWCISLASARLLDYKKGSLGLNVQILVHFPGCHWVRFNCSDFGAFSRLSLGKVQLFIFWCIFLASAMLLHSARSHWVKFKCSDFGIIPWLPPVYFTLTEGVLGEVSVPILGRFPGCHKAT